MQNHEQVIVKRNMLGEKIKQLRLARGLSQSEVGNGLSEFGIVADQKMVSAVERGIRSLFDYEIIAFANYFDIDYNEIFSV